MLVVSASFCYSTRKWETLKKRIICRTFFSLIPTSLVSLFVCSFCGLRNQTQIFSRNYCSAFGRFGITYIRSLTGCSVVGWGAWKWHWSDSRCAGIFHILYLIKSFALSEWASERTSARDVATTIKMRKLDFVRILIHVVRAISCNLTCANEMYSPHSRAPRLETYRWMGSRFVPLFFDSSFVRSVTA